MFKVDDAIREISATVGAGTYTLGGAVAGFRPFSTIGANVYTRFFATDGVNREWGIGRYLAGPDRLERTHILGSTNGGAAVVWGAGNKTLRCGPLAAMDKPRVVTVNVAGGAGTTVLTQSEQRCDVLILTGALTGARILEVDDTPWAWSAIINNTTGAFPTTVRATGQTGLKFYQGRATAAVHNGTDVQKAADDPAPGTYEDYQGGALQVARLLCDGANVLRATHPALTQELIKSAVITFTNGTDRVNWAAHGLVEGDVFKFYNAGGAAPTGLTASVAGGATTTYFVINPTANDFQIAATEGGAAVLFSTDGTGVHTGIHAPHGDGDGVTTVTLPDSRRRASVGAGGTGTATLRKRPGAAGGAESVALTAAEVAVHAHGHAHTHSDYYQVTNVTGTNNFLTGGGKGVNAITSIGEGGASTTTGGASTGTTDNAGSGTAHNNLSPSLVVTRTIRT